MQILIYLITWPGEGIHNRILFKRIDHFRDHFVRPFIWFRGCLLKVIRKVYLDPLRLVFLVHL